MAIRIVNRPARSETEPEPTRAGYAHISLRAIAAASFAVALTCLAALIVVASIKDVDTLSTVALALAIVTFVAQLIVFVLQTNAANQQLVQSQQLHSELLRLLGEMGERMRGTEATVSSMNEKLLEAALGKALGTGSGVGSDARAIASRVAELLGLPVTADAPATLRSAPLNEGLNWQVGARDEALRYLTSFPGDVDPAFVQTLLDMPADAMSALRNFGEDEIGWAGTDNVGLGLPPNAGVQSLRANGLIEVKSESIGAMGLWVLTPLGRDAVRLLMSSAPPPLDIEDSVSILRARAGGFAAG